jgi:hypothetical protein
MIGILALANAAAQSVTASAQQQVFAVFIVFILSFEVIANPSLSGSYRAASIRSAMLSRQR